MKENQLMIDILKKEFLQSREAKALHSLLAGEIAAVEAYDLAIARMRDREIIPTLEECRLSHELRVQILQERMDLLAEDHLESSGWWGVVTRFVENSAIVISDRVALSVLTAGEDFGFSQYELHMRDLDPQTYVLAENDLLPAQGRTLETMSLLCAVMRSEEHSDKLDSACSAAEGKAGKSR